MCAVRGEHSEFDLKLAIECANAYSNFSGLGCTVSTKDGEILHEVGYGCASCALCDAAGLEKSECICAHIYGMTESERFGGKYIYFCPMGLTCFVSPIMGEGGLAAKITVGPFLMVEKEDYIAFDLKHKLKLGDRQINTVLKAMSNLPYVTTGKVNSLSILLFMSVGFMNNVSEANRMQKIQDSDRIQGQITAYIMELKADNEVHEYPIDTEKSLIACIANSDKTGAQKYLNELLGHILFSSGGDFSRIKSHIYELLVIISRAAIDSGAMSEHTFEINHSFFQRAQSSINLDELCMLLSEVMNKYIDSLFEFTHVKNADVIHKAVHYMRKNCTKKVTLEDVAEIVFLSPTYFSKMFKAEMGQSFNHYLNQMRIEKSKQFLLQSDMHLVDIANMSGFEDQSYFTKVFKRIAGMSPYRYRKSKGRR